MYFTAGFLQKGGTHIEDDGSGKVSSTSFDMFPLTRPSAFALLHSSRREGRQLLNSYEGGCIWRVALLYGTGIYVLVFPEHDIRRTRTLKHFLVQWVGYRCSALDC